MLIGCNGRNYLFLFFFFKQKTAYEMRISDGSSDVCSSDLGGRPGHPGGLLQRRRGADRGRRDRRGGRPGAVVLRRAVAPGVRAAPGDRTLPDDGQSSLERSVVRWIAEGDSIRPRSAIAGFGRKHAQVGEGAGEGRAKGKTAVE